MILFLTVPACVQEFFDFNRRMRCSIVAMVALAIGMAALPSPARAQTREYILAEHDDLKAVLRIKSPATLADDDWLQIEIINSGPVGRIKTVTIDAPSEHDGMTNSNDLYEVTLGDRKSTRLNSSHRL